MSCNGIITETRKGILGALLSRIEHLLSRVACTREQINTLHYSEVIATAASSWSSANKLDPFRVGKCEKQIPLNAWRWLPHFRVLRKIFANSPSSKYQILILMIMGAGFSHPVDTSFCHYFMKLDNGLVRCLIELLTNRAVTFRSICRAEISWEWESVGHDRHTNHMQLMYRKISISIQICCSCAHAKILYHIVFGSVRWCVCLVPIMPC